MNTVALPAVTVTAPRIDRPLPLTPDIPTFRPILPDISANQGQFTNFLQLYQSINMLAQQQALLAANIDFILSQLSPAEQAALADEIQMLKTLQQQAVDAKAIADRKSNEQVSALRAWKIYDSPKYKTEEQKVDALNFLLSVLHVNGLRWQWESEYGRARRQQIAHQQNW